MGVLECSRSGCPNIMCNHYSHRYGYICDDCFNELVEYCKRKGVTHGNVKEFMNSEREERYHFNTVETILLSEFKLI